MPLYVYEILGDDGEPLTFKGEKVFDDVEVFQHIDEAPLTEHHGHPVRRVPCLPRLQRNREGQAARSVQLAFDPAGRKELYREVPALRDCVDDDGSVHFRNAAHRDQVYRQIDQARRDFVERDSERGNVDLAKAGYGDPTQAAAVGKKGKGPIGIV